MSEHLDNYIIHELTIEDPNEQGDQEFHGIFGKKEKETADFVNSSKIAARTRRITRKNRSKARHKDS